MSRLQYAELFCQSNFTFLTGASHPEELIAQACALGYQALAITDECSVAGVVRAYSVIKQHQLEIKLIVGSYFQYQGTQLVLLCPNRKAYAELCRIITNARRRCEKGKYLLSEWDLMSVKECLVIWLPKHSGQTTEIGYWLRQYHQHRLWIGIQRHLMADDQEQQQYIESLAVELKIPITACGGVLMHIPERLNLQHILTAIRLNSAVEKVSAHLLMNTERSLRQLQKLGKLFKREWLDESIVIAALCEFNLASLRYEYPTELVPQSLTPIQYLRQLVEKGKAIRFPSGSLSPIIEQTIEKELVLIEELDYSYYFLTIHDLVMFAKHRGILYQGRGSAANSIVCYCLEITAVDPTQISVLFERFISKERDEPPDIDVDFEHERREEVIQYLYQKYGRERAALAATVISYRFKSAIRDVGKALGLEENQLDYFIKNVNRRDKEQGWEAQLIQLGLKPESLKGQQFISLVQEMIGFPRHLSQHVGGFVISSGPLYEMVPVENAAMAERTVIQWDKDDLESLGLLKVDVLALGMLSAIRKCFTLIQTHYRQTLTIADITRRRDDANVYEMIQNADTIGVFQIESRAQMNMLPRLKPRCYYDLVIQIAIVRPGPIQGDMVHPFLKRRNGIESVEYPSDEVKEVLERTMGVPIFQEQVIKLAMVAAGFSGGQADQLRRAMASWKKNGQLMKFKAQLIGGMQKNGYSHNFAETLFEQICGFAGYGFPESHSASFAVLAYCSAWLKYYYPECFYSALLNSLPMGFYSPSQIIQDARRHNITILPVCINASIYDHQVVTHGRHLAIRLGLRLVRNLSVKGIEQLLYSRPLNGFTSINQIKAIKLTSSDMQALASANTMASLTQNRYQTRWELMDTITETPLFAEEQATDYSPITAPNDIDSLIEDYSAIGLSLDHHPITLLEKAGHLGKFIRASALTQKSDRSLVTVVGVVTGRQSPGTAAGVTFLTLEDDSGNTNVVVWQATARAQKNAFLTAKILMVKGIMEREGDVIHVVAGRLIDLTNKLDQLVTHSRDFH
ncbi:error-prone DNA polymerase [Vibrio viridaestus]|uniref:Error-prone DNA polymerase n=1 Tax=Vibrio viridaestus TaxID=2487322 RepID=A0A3N9TJ90_9VIBR|nr:error-prone DNA polymerase [Vibrio viridaestus]RQW64230.1 DNA polymerase III subunit alpha [Vibrio viridaestus]